MLIEIIFFACDFLYFISFKTENKKLHWRDTSTTESDSKAEDIVSPKASKNYSCFGLTPAREEAKAARETS